MVQTLRTIFQDYCQANGKISRETALQIMEQTDLQKMVDQIAVNIPVFYEEKQKLLEAVDLTERFEQLSVLLENEIQVMNIKTEIQEKVKARVDKNQREYILREQLKVIREELGEDTTGAEADHFQEETDKLEASDEVKERIEKEIERFKNAGNNSAESSVIRGYIETLLELPWDKESVDNMDLANAREILDEDHYGLEKVKERVLEFLAVRTLTKKGDSPIICLVGPPGTGKTSIARSIARALDKKYVRICLGGVRDEAEIRGHRRTYIGAMPGRIANGMKQAGVKNPLMLLDEIDKVSSDYKGDTSSAHSGGAGFRTEQQVPRSLCGASAGSFRGAFHRHGQRCSDDSTASSGPYGAHRGFQLHGKREAAHCKRAPVRETDREKRPLRTMSFFHLRTRL